MDLTGFQLLVELLRGRRVLCEEVNTTTPYELLPRQSNHQQHFGCNFDDAYWEDLNDHRLSEPEEDKERDKHNEIPAPKVIRIEVIASLDIVFAGHNGVTSPSPKQCAYLVWAQVNAAVYIRTLGCILITRKLHTDTW